MNSECIVAVVTAGRPSLKKLIVALSIAAIFASMSVAQPLFAQSSSVAVNRLVDPLGANSLRADQQMQGHARESARRLVESCLDSQLRQLKQNGLQNLDVCQEIDLMRDNLDSLMTTNMQAVFELLAKAEQAAPSERGALFKQAKEKIRAILTRLIAERQKLSRRLHAAQLAAQVRSLIDKQNTVRTTTKSLSDATHGRQADLTLATIQSQQDVSMLFGQLIAALSDAESWGGDIASRSAAALRILRTGQAPTLIDAASRSLESANFPEAANSQQKLVDVLGEVLHELEFSRGADSQIKRELLETIHDLQHRQTAIRQQTQQTDRPDAQLDKLVDRQAAVKKDLAKLDAALETIPATKSDLDQAKAAAERAAADLFNAQRGAAIDEQSKTLANLDRIERAVEQASQKGSAARSAAELAEQLRQLQSASQRIAEARSQEKQAGESRASPQSATAYGSASDNLNLTAQLPQLPEALKSLLQQAASAARSAAESQQNDDDSQRASAAQKAQESIDRAEAAIAGAVNETKLGEKAVSAGELARAAEAVERVASAERQIAKETNEAARGKGLMQDQARRLTADQLAVKKVAESLTDGIKDRSPDAAAALVAARSSINAAGHDLVAAQRLSGEATMRADADAAMQATAASDKLRDAAAQLRKTVSDEAGKLAQVADEQMGAVTSLRRQIQGREGEPPQPNKNQRELAQRLAAIDPDAGSELRRAGDRSTVQKALQTADSSLAARQQQLENAKSLAEQIADSAKQQQQARNEIVAAADKLAEATAQVRSRVPAGGDQKFPATNDVAAMRALLAAEQSFAEAQTQIGDNSEQASGQTKIANQPIRDALEAASQLGPQTDGATAAQRGSSAAPNRPPSQEPQTTEIERQAAQALGTELLPNSPQITAQQIAGREVSSEMASFEQQAATTQAIGSNRKGGKTPSSSNNQQQANVASPGIGSASPASQGGAGIKSGRKTANLDLPPSELLQSPVGKHSNDSRTATDLTDRDTGRTTGSAGEEPSWFAALPPEARGAIRAKAHQPAPMAYRDQLRDYFESEPDGR